MNKMVDGSLDALDDDGVVQLCVADCSRFVRQLHVRKCRHENKVGRGVLRPRAVDIWAVKVDGF